MAEASAGSVASTTTSGQTAPASVAGSQTTTDPASLEQRNTADDDPEVDYGEGVGKVKRSKVKELITKRRDFDRAAHQRFEEAAKLRRENDAAEGDFAKLQARAKKGDKGAIWELAQKLGLDPDELAENRLSSALERSRMTPEQLEMEEIKAENARLKQTNEQTAEEKKQAHQTELTGHWVQQFDKAFGPAMTAVKLAKTPHSVARMAAIVEQFIANEQPIDAEWAAQIVQGEQRTVVRDTLEAVTDDTELAELLGDGVLARVQRMQLAKAIGNSAQKQPSQKQTPFAAKPKQPLTFEEVRQKLKLGS